MKKPYVLFAAALLFFCGCSAKSQTTETTENTAQMSVYEDEYIALEYDSNIVSCSPYDASEIDDMEYYFIATLADNTISESIASPIDVTNLYIVVGTSDNSLYDSYQSDYKKTFSVFCNSLYGIDEITANDVSGSLSTSVRLEKTLSNGNIIKGKILSIDENFTVYAFLNILPDVENYKTESLTKTYDTIVYKNPEISSSETGGIKTYSDNWITLKYDSALIAPYDNAITDNYPSYSFLLIPANSSYTSDSAQYSYITVLSIENFADNDVQPTPEVCATYFNAMLQIEEITAADVSEMSCNKVLSDGKQINAAVLKSDSDKVCIALCNIMPNENTDFSQAFENAFDSIVYTRD